MIVANLSDRVVTPPVYPISVHECPWTLQRWVNIAQAAPYARAGLRAAWWSPRGLVAAILAILVVTVAIVLAISR